MKGSASMGYRLQKYRTCRPKVQFIYLHGSLPAWCGLNCGQSTGEARWV